MYVFSSTSLILYVILHKIINSRLFVFPNLVFVFPCLVVWICNKAFFVCYSSLIDFPTYVILAFCHGAMEQFSPSWSMTMSKPGFFVENNALHVVPPAVIARIHAQSGLLDACMGVCQVCCTQHFFRHGACATEKGIGPWIVKAIQGLLIKNNNFINLARKPTSSSQTHQPHVYSFICSFLVVQNSSAPVHIVFTCF